MTNKTNDYHCFSWNLTQYLMSNGLDVVSVDVHRRTNKPFWIFSRNSELDVLLDNWANKKNLR